MLQVEVCKSEGWQPQKNVGSDGFHGRDSTPPANRRWVAGWNSICRCLLIFRDANLCFIYTCPIRYHVSLLPFSAPFPHLGCPNDMEPMNSFMMWTVASAESGRKTTSTKCHGWGSLSHFREDTENMHSNNFQQCDYIHILYNHNTYISIFTKPNNAPFFLANHPKKNTILQGTSAAGDLA